MRRTARLAGALLATATVLAAAAAAGPFALSSPDIAPGGRIAEAQVFDGFGCKGGNVSPALAWSNAPEGTRSFALLVHDPDAPTGSGWWHWLIFNIPPNVTQLPAGAGKPESAGVPQGSIQSLTDFGQPGFGGPCPPPGDKPHRYIFTVFALKVDQLPLKKDASGAMVGYYLHQNAIGKASFTGTYGR